MRRAWALLPLAVLLLAQAPTSEIRVVVDGERLAVEVPPVEVAGRVLVPLREIFERLGAEVGFAEATRTVHVRRGDMTVRLVVGGTVAWVNDRPTPLDVPVSVIRGRVMVPLRFVSEALGAVVEWDGASRTVVITSRPPSPPRGYGRPPGEHPASPAPVAVSLVHDARRPLRAGEVLTVVLRGTPGVRARFFLGDMAQGLSMVERLPGEYVGTYTVRRQDDLTEAPVFGRLASGSASSAVVPSALPVTLDPIPPRLVVAVPPGGVLLANQRPNLLVVADDGPGSGVREVRVVLRAGEVVQEAVSETGILAFAPLRPLPEGPVEVRVRVEDRAQNAVEHRWSFSVQTRGRAIRAVTFEPARPLREGEVLTVWVLGEPGGEATFTLEGMGEKVPMRELESGRYVGTYRVQPGDRLWNGQVRVTLKRRGGGVVRAATAGVILAARPPAPPVVERPRGGERVRSPLLVRGRAEPGDRVRVTLLSESTVGAVPVLIRLGGGEVLADSGGQWEKAFRFPPLFRGARLVLVALAVGPTGQESTPSAVLVTGE
ncbi:MAG: copper amine oxidase N-terminal domain-containing protein [Armatimonadota bacterium]|nr:copper amine oxidase N-terminal domain-containing protein [Armatimonadota bacterium]MDR7444442.1 copper amine oxidase N-terminal domain-containing protein [Armatimonadota bacterium]MDR7570144.1 copper amine oxidase N-terminal domain-containing protein [Armatimonadota bacterium]MDR7615253.1 copper amine oxidase N-terminal domain-containing protein [Armatimonadota bacterium]